MPKATKHLRWQLKNKIEDYIDRRGAGFIEDKYVNIIVDDALEVYKEEYGTVDVDTMIERVVDYYLDKIYKSHAAVSDNTAIETLNVGEGMPSKVKKDMSGIKMPKDEVEGDVGKIPCRICGGKYKVLYPHLIAKHNLVPEQYRKMFPHSPLRAGLPEKEQEARDRLNEKKKKESLRSPQAGDLRRRIIALAKQIKQIEGGI